MNIFLWLNLALTAWDEIAKRTKKTADDKIGREIRAALAEIEKRRGTQVTQIQLEELRTAKKW